MRLRCSAAAGHIRRFAPNPAGQGYVPMPDYLVAFYDSGRTFGRIGRGLQVRPPAVFWDISASPMAAKFCPILSCAAPLIASRLRVESQDNACCDGASSGSQSMCTLFGFSEHVDASVKSCIAIPEDGGCDAIKHLEAFQQNTRNALYSQPLPLMCVCAGALGHGDWTRRQPVHRHG